MGAELEQHDPFSLPDEEDFKKRPRWWYAAQLRVAGASWSEIAEAVGYDSEMTALIEVKKGRRSRKKEELEDLVDLELERLDALQLIAWRTAKDGDLKALDAILRIMSTRMKLLGTEKKADESGVTQHNTAIFIGGTEGEYTEALKRAREAAIENKRVIEG